MKKLILLAFAAFLAGATANAQESIKPGKVPDAVKAHFENDVNKDALKTASWYVIGKDYMCEYNQVSRRYTKYGIFVYSLQYIDKADVKKDAIEHFEKKFASEYNFQRAALATMSDGQQKYFLIAKDTKTDYYFVYSEKGKFDEKVEVAKFKYEPKK